MTAKRLDRLRLLLGRELTVAIDRPLGSRHPEWGFRYPVNYGYIPGMPAADGEEQDAYVLGVPRPLKQFTGRCVAIIHRLDDVEDKLVVVPAGTTLDAPAIREATAFQEAGLRTRILLEPARDAGRDKRGEA